MREIVITSLEQLKDWNSNPTIEKPIVMDWWLDWIIDECPKEFLNFLDAMEIYYKFTEICEKLCVNLFLAVFINVAPSGILFMSTKLIEFLVCSFAGI